MNDDDVCGLIFCWTYGLMKILKMICGMLCVCDVHQIVCVCGFCVLCVMVC